MAREVDNTIHYLMPPDNCFWHWADGGRVIAWKIDGMTFCYREVLFQVLRQMETEGLPRLGALLLVLHACQHPMGSRERLALLRVLGPDQHKSVALQLENVFALFQNIRALPPALRSGQKRIQLLSGLFAASQVSLSKDHFLSVAGDLEAGYWSNDFAQFRSEDAVNYLKDDLACLEKIYNRYPTAESLEIKLGTGLDELPEPLSIPDNAITSTDLLDQLLEDPKTAGISRVARKLLPVINIPMHSRAAGDQPIGGIADITNRGNYDKLLLSELAQDDLLLTARLINNEALYFRREEPPQHPTRKKIILIDATIRMWGIPRVYAMAAALAFARNAKHGEEVEAYLLEEEEFDKISINTRKGVMNALGHLHHGLHAGKALEEAIKKLASEKNNEFVLITEERQLLSPSFHAIFSMIRAELSFLITLNRDGNIYFSEYVKGRSKLLNEAKIDLQDLFIQPAKKSQTQVVRHNYGISSLPKFLEGHVRPLLLVKKRIQYGVSSMVASPDNNAVAAINRNQRVIFLWEDRGALEMLPFIEQGTYYFNWTEDLTLYLVVNNTAVTKLYIFDLMLVRVLEFDFRGDIGNVQGIVFSAENLLYLFSPDDRLVFDCKKGVTVEKSWKGALDNKKVLAYGIQRSVMNHVSQELFNKVMSMPALRAPIKFRRIYVSRNGCLGIDGSYIAWTRDDISLIWSNHLPVAVHASPGKEVFFTGTKSKYRVWTWPDGSEAIIDKRGVLHLRSSGDIPEVSIILVEGIPMSCWASTGEVCGNRFFIDSRHTSMIIGAETFYRKYIHPFVHQIINRCS